MFCNKCGTLMDDNAVLCPVCGAPAQANIGGAAPNPTPNPNPYPPTGGYGQQPYGQQYGQQYVQQPVYGQQKSKVAAGLLALFLGCFGVHNFYLGYTKNAVIQLVLTLVLGWIGVGLIATAIWAIIDAVNIFTGKMPDANGVPLSD